MHEELLQNILLGILIVEIAICGHVLSKSISKFTKDSKSNKKI